MKQEIVINSATRGNVDGNNYSSVWASTEDEKHDADNVGYPPMKINCERSIIDQLRGKLPAKVECKIKMISASGSKSGNFIAEVFKITPITISPIKV